MQTQSIVAARRYGQCLEYLGRITRIEVLNTQQNFAMSITLPQLNKKNKLSRGVMKSILELDKR